MSKKDKNKKKSFFSKLTAKFKKKTRRWFKPDSSGKTNYLARIFFEFAIATPIVILEGIKAGFYLAFTQKNGTFDAILEGILTPFWDVIKLKESQISSFGSSPFDATPLGLLILVEIIAFALMLTAAERLNGQSQRKDGDMTFADIDDFNEVMAYCDEAGNPIDPPENGKQVGNMILSKNVRYSLEPKGTNTYSCALVVGATGCGKTFTYVKPNLLQFTGSYCITDPKGELLQDVGSALLQHGYNIKVFNINEPKFSCGYNPFHYIHSETDVVSVVDAFLQNSKDEKAGSDSFFDPAEKNFYLMLFYYIWTVYKDEPEKQTFKTFYEIYQMANEQDVALRKGEAPETSEFDKLFIELAKNDPSNPALPFYSTFKKGTPKTKQSILISVGVKLWFLSDSSIANLMAKDTMEFEKLGDRKTALFIIIPSEKKTFKFLSAMFLTQLFETLFYMGNTVNEKTYFIQKDNCVAFRSEPFNTKAERKQAKIDLIEKQKIWSKYGYIEEIETENDEPIAEDDDELMFAYKPARIVRKNADGEIVVLEEFQSRQAAELVLDAIKNGKLVKGSKTMVNHIRFLLDEFYATGKIPGFEEKIATFRSLRISSDIIIQSISQLQEMYDGLEDKIINNCSIQILLGANSMTDCEYFSKLAGQTTVKSTSLSYDGSQLMAGAKSASVSQNAQQLIRPENIRSMDKGDCLIFVNTQKPITDKKFPSTSHKNWTQTYSDKDPKLKDNVFLFREVFTIKQEDKNRVVTKLNDLQLPVDVNGRGKSGFNRPVVSGQVSNNKNKNDLPNSERAKSGSVKTGIDNFNNTTKNYNKEKEDAKKRQDEVMNKMRNEDVETRVSNEITNPDGSLNPTIAASLLVKATMVNDNEAIANPDERFKKASKYVNVKIDSEDDTNMFDI